MTKEPTNAVAVPMVTNDTDAMRGIRSYQDALEFIESMNIPTVDSQEFGDGFEVAKDKGELVGVPFIILGIKVKASDYSDDKERVIVHVVTNDGRKRILSDGGTGLAEQAISIHKNHPFQGLGVKCAKGLTRSDYIYVDSDGVRTPATTYYLS